MYHQIETNMPVKNFLQETRQFLGKMIRIVNISEDLMISINLISDIAYGREIVEEYIPQMQVSYICHIFRIEFALKRT